MFNVNCVGNTENTHEESVQFVCYIVHKSDSDFLCRKKKKCIAISGGTMEGVCDDDCDRSQKNLRTDPVIGNQYHTELRAEFCEDAKVFILTKCNTSGGMRNCIDMNACYSLTDDTSEGVSKSFRTESITKYKLTFGITR